jgi:hypothetical protein
MDKLTTQNRNQPARNQLATRKNNRKPLYRRPRFWGVVALATIVAVGLALYFLTKVFPDSTVAGVDTAKIVVDTDPDKATIVMDGKELKKESDTTITAKVGKHTIKLSLAGYDDQEVIVDLVKDQTYQLQHTFVKNGQTVLPTPKAGQSATTTYTNQKYGYQLTYPSSWSVDTDNSGVAHFYNDAATKRRQQSPNAEIEEAMAVLVQPNPQNKSPLDFYKSREEYAMEDQSQIPQRSLTISGQPAYQFDTPYGFVPYTITILTGKGNAYLFQIHQGSPDRKLYDDILNSFKLT